jgi:hypothetical protein
MPIRRTRNLVLLVAVLGAGCDSGPQIDPARVVPREALAPAAVNCLMFEAPDYRGWPSRPADRAYVAFLQSHKVSVAFTHWEDDTHAGLVGIRDAARLPGLYAAAEKAGLLVPEFPVGGRIPP